MTVSSSRSSSREPPMPGMVHYYICNAPTCTYVSERSDPVKRHLLSHCPTYRPFHCRLCDFKTQRQDTCLEHCQKQHGQQNCFFNENEVKPSDFIEYSPKRIWLPRVQGNQGSSAEQ